MTVHLCHKLAYSLLVGVYTFTGLDYWTGTLDWTDIFLVFTHVVVGLIDFHWLGVLRKYLAYP